MFYCIDWNYNDLIGYKSISDEKINNCVVIQLLNTSNTSAASPAGTTRLFVQYTDLLCAIIFYICSALTIMTSNVNEKIYNFGTESS